MVWKHDEHENCLLDAKASGKDFCHNSKKRRSGERGLFRGILAAKRQICLASLEACARALLFSKTWSENKNQIVLISTQITTRNMHRGDPRKRRSIAVQAS